MESKFPPVTTHENEVAALLSLLGCVIIGHSAVYVSAPITSGKRLARWLSARNLEFDPSHPDNYAEFQREVLEPNCEHAKTIVTELRKQFSILIDPTALKDIEGWTQDDYRYLWGEVIKQFAVTLVFIDGWQYSNGCTYEFLVSYQSSNDQQPLVLDERLKPLTLADGLRLIREAIREVQETKLSTEFLEQVARELARTVAADELCAKP